MRRRRCRSSRGGEAGFTLVEVIAGMVVLSLVGAGVWTAAAASLRSAARLEARARANARLLMLDDLLRDEVGRIRAPWWQRPPEVEGLTGAWRIPWLDGDPDRALALTFKEGSLLIDNSSSTMSFDGFTSVDVKPATADSGAPFGLIVVLESERSPPVTLVCRYGSSSLQGGNLR